MNSEFNQSNQHLSGQIEGLRCGHCVQTIEKAFSGMAGAKTIHINLNDATFEAWVASDFRGADLVQEAESLGFRLQLGANQRKEKKEEGIWAGEQKFLIHGSVALVLAASVMMLSLSIYLGLDAAEEPQIFNIFQKLIFGFGMLAAINVLGFFLSPVLVAARKGIMHPDASIVLSTLLMVGASVYSLINFPTEHLFLDGLSVFGFLLFLSRYISEQTHAFHRRVASEPIPLKDWTMRKKMQSGYVLTAVDKLVSGDVILLSYGDIVPSDARLLSDTSQFSYAWSTGEAAPKTIETGSDIEAGCQYLGTEDAQVEVSAAFENSDFYQQLSSSHSDDAKTNKHANMVEPQNAVDITSHAQRLYLVFFLVSFAVGLGLFFFVEPIDGVRRLAALSLVLCPCIVSLVEPISQSMLVSSLRQSGIIVKNLGALTRIGKLRELCFDKTGTLSNGVLTLEQPQWIQQLSPHMRNLLRHLTYGNAHPKAQAIDAVLAEIDGNIFNYQASERKTVPGKGVSIELGEQSASLMADSDGRLIFNIDGEEVLSLGFKEVFTSELRSGLKILQSRGLSLHVLSGDGSQQVEAFCQQASELKPTYRGQMSSDDKAQYIRGLGDSVLYCGDGFNDLQAMKESDVSVAVIGSRPEVTSSADILLWQISIAQLVQLFKAQRFGELARIYGYGYAAIYNIVLAGLALNGYLTATLAAIIMPISLSFFVGTLYLVMKRSFSNASQRVTAESRQWIGRTA